MAIGPGYRRKNTTTVVHFADDRYADLHIIMKAASMKTMLTALELAAKLERMGENPTAGVGTMRQLMELFASKLVQWNLLDENGDPVPPTVDGLLECDPSEAIDMVMAWADTALGVDAPLDPTSVAGKRSAEAPPLPPAIPLPSR